MRVATVVGCAAYVAAAMKGYAIVATLGYAYMGFRIRPVGWWMVAAFGLALLPSLFLPVSARRPSTVLAWFLYLIAYVPLTFVPMWSLRDVEPAAAFRFSAFVGAMYTLVLLSTRIRRASLPVIPRRVARIAIGVLTVGLLAYVAATHGLSLKLPALDDVYRVRSQFKANAASAGRFATYAVFWLANVLNPLFLATGITRRKPLLVAVGILGQLILFSMTGFKSVLMSIALVPAMALLLGRRLQHAGPRMVWAAAAGVGLALLWTRATTLLVRRLLMTGVISGWYFEFFSSNPRARMGNSILGFLTEYPYPLPLPNLIAGHYLQRPATSANGNLWADAFANFGFAGIALWSVVLAAYLWVYDTAAAGRDAKLCALLLVMPGLSLSNVALQTALLTHGLALLVLVVFSLPTEREASHRRAVHFSSVHQPFDVRIFEKQCRSLARDGWDVTFVVPHTGDCERDGVALRTVPRLRGRAARMIVTTTRVAVRVLRSPAEVYHFHDAELLPVGVLLKLLGRRVVYDSHEDLPRAILSKPYVAPPLRRVVGRSFELFENWCARRFDAVVGATEHIASRFRAAGARAVVVANYPQLSEYPPPPPWGKKEDAVCFVGGITRIRGIVEMIDAAEIAGVRLILAGAFSSESLRSEAASRPGWRHVEELGVISRAATVEVMRRSVAGLVLYHPEPNHIDAGPNKLFEYMAAGLPVIASDFPRWRRLVTGRRVGLVVDPLDPHAIAGAIETFRRDPARAQEAGRRGRRAVESTYTWASQYQTLKTLYASLTKTEEGRS